MTDSIKSIGSSKEVEDRMNITVEKKTKDIEYLKTKVDSLQRDNITFVQDRDTLRMELHLLNESRKRIIHEKEAF